MPNSSARKPRIHQGGFLVRPHARGFPAHAQTPLSEYVRLRERDLSKATHERLLTGVSIASLRETPKEKQKSKEFISAMRLAKESIAGKLAKVALENDEFNNFLKKRKYVFVDSSGGITLSGTKMPWGYTRIACEDIRWLMAHLHLG